MHKFQHPQPKRPQYSPHPAPEPQFGTKAQNLSPSDQSPLLDDEGKTFIRQVTGSFLFYAQMIDNTMLKALKKIDRKQDKPTMLTKKWTQQLLDYAATYPNTSIRYYKSDMILKQYSDSSYNNEENARSSYGGYFFLGWNQPDNEQVRLNGALLAEVNVLKLVAASAAESELGALFKNMQRGVILRLTSQEMGHPQPPTDVWIDNTTTHGIANSTFK